MHLRVDGVDCIGKNILRLRPKIYFADHGFREAFFSGSNNRNIEQVLENIVATELTRRGWSLRFGSVSDKKVDFVADKKRPENVRPGLLSTCVRSNPGTRIFSASGYPRQLAKTHTFS